MSKDSTEKPTGSGYGNIYTPHAGSMIIHVQRESGLANRTIVLSPWQVRLLRRGLYAGAILLAIVLLSWFYFATQAARVPSLTHRIRQLQHDVTRVDTLQAALTELEGRFQQVQHMLGATAAPKPGATADTTVGTPPNRWPLPSAGMILTPTDSAAPQHGIDIAIPAGTPIRASGAGIVVEVRDDPQYGTLVRIAHPDGYESIYGNTANVRVNRGDTVHSGDLIALSSGTFRGLPPHLHFEILHGKVDVDPASLMKEGPAHGDLQ